MGLYFNLASVSVSDPEGDPLTTRRAGQRSVPSELASRFDLVVERIPVAGRTLSILAVRDTNKLLDAIDPATFALDERLPFWAELWPSSIALARFCLERCPVAGRTVLELGCGLGVAGIAAALAGASVTMTDYEEDALAFARWNVSQNPGDGIPGGSVSIRHLDWREPGSPGVFDLIIGSDIIYDRRHSGPLLDLFDRHLAPDGTAVLTDPGREAGREFIESARRRGFTVASTGWMVDWRARTHHGVCLEVRRDGIS